jgi:hypothetical protein
MEALKAQGADTFLWQVGGDVPLAYLGKKMAKKFEVRCAVYGNWWCGVVEPAL